MAGDVEQRQVMAGELYDAAADALRPYAPEPPCRAVYSVLSVYAALRAEHPKWSRDVAMAAAAHQIADHVGLTGGSGCTH